MVVSCRERYLVRVTDVRLSIAGDEVYTAVETVMLQNAMHHVHLDRREKGRKPFPEAITDFIH